MLQSFTTEALLPFHCQVTASVTSSTHERKSKTNIVLSKRSALSLRHNAFV